MSNPMFALLGRLAKHKPHRKLSLSDLTNLLYEYVQDLDAQHFTVEHVEKACDEWRLSENTTYFPQISELIPICRKYANVRQTPHNPAYDEWRRPTGEEYEAMGMRDKIRAQILTAQELELQAITLLQKTTGNRNITLMPDDGKRLMAKASDCREKAATLRKLLNEAKSRPQPQSNSFVPALRTMA